MATLKTKFDLGAEVWKVHSDREEIKLPCRFCRGQGWLPVEGAGGASESVKCPRCGVKSTVTLGTWPVWRVETSPLKIGMIQLRVVDRSRFRESSSEPLTNGDPERVIAEDEENYMAWSSGVGSGTIHYVEDLFASREEAEEEAEQRTERARAGEDPGGRKERTARWWPSAQQVQIAAGFLDHRDVYEHDAAHVALAEAIVEVAARRERESR